MYGIEQGSCVYVGGRSLTGLAESEPGDDGDGRWSRRCLKYSHSVIMYCGLERWAVLGGFGNRRNGWG